MDSIGAQKNAVRDFWNAEPCGSRYANGEDGFAAHSQARYTLEPYITGFAGFHEAKNLAVLEIGVGMGADYLEWLKGGAHAVGVDLSKASIENAKRRCLDGGYQPDLRVADAESLPFPPDFFDLVYSYGAIHHSPNTEQCAREAYRVLKPGGRLRVMIYQHPSITGFMLWLRHGLIRGKSLRKTVFDHLESPGTKTYTPKEARELFNAFEDVNIEVVFSPGDLLLHKASARYQSAWYQAVWKIFPRALVRGLFKKWGLFLLISGTKPV